MRWGAERTSVAWCCCPEGEPTPTLSSHPRLRAMLHPRPKRPQIKHGLFHDVSNWDLALLASAFITGNLHKILLRFHAQCMY